MEIKEQVAPRAEEEQVRMTEGEAAPKAEEEAPMAVVEEAPLVVEEEAPMTVVEEAHMAVVEEAPMAVVEEAPLVVEEEAPMTVVEEAPMAVVEEAPLVVEEEAPLVVEEEARRAEEEAPMAVEEKVHRAEEEVPIAVEEEEVPIAVEEEARMDKEEEARRAKMEAEKRFIAKDYNGALSHALRAEILCPGLEGIKEMKATFHVYAASQIKFNGETDFYAVFGLKQSAAIKARVIKQYTDMCRLLNPNCNKTVGADGAFNLLSEAWNILSDLKERTSYDIRRNTRGDSFWTKCTTCEVHYEYLLKFLNKNLSCKNCRGVFKAIIGKNPPDGSYSFRGCQHFPAPEHGYANQVGSTTTNIPTTKAATVPKSKRKSFSGSSVAVADTSSTIPREAHATGNGNKSELSKLGRPSKRKMLDDSGVEKPTSDMGASEPTLDSRKILVNIALAELRKKLPELRKADAEVAAQNQKEAAAAAGSSSGGGRKVVKKRA